RRTARSASTRSCRSTGSRTRSWRSSSATSPRAPMNGTTSSGHFWTKIDPVGTILPGLGPSERVPLLNRELDLSALGLKPEDYFVLSRVDGRTTLKQLFLISGVPETQAIAIVRRLHEVGAIFFDGETPRGVPELPLEGDSGPIVIDEKLLGVPD